MSDVHIRLAGAEEAHVVHAIMRAAFAEYASGPHPSSALRETVDDVEAAMAKGGGLLALRGGRYVASGRFTVDRATGVLAFERLAVLPGERGRNLGGRTIDWLEAHARALGLSEVHVTARSREPDNRPYYLSRGYEIRGYSARYGIPDIRTHMCKHL